MLNRTERQRIEEMLRWIEGKTSECQSGTALHNLYLVHDHLSAALDADKLPRGRKTFGELVEMLPRRKPRVGVNYGALGDEEDP